VNAIRPVLEEGYRVNVHHNPYPAIAKNLSMISHEPADKLMQGVGMCPFQKNLPSIAAGNFG
jgi:hypothetical protein